MSDAQKKIVTVGRNGQISIGSEYAGRILEITYRRDGRIELSLGRFVPDHQEVFFTPAADEKLRAFSEWEKTESPSETDVAELRRTKPMKRSKSKSAD